MCDAMPDPTFDATDHLTLVEAVDRVLNKGAVIAGDVTISVADVELIRLGLQVVLAAHDSLVSLASESERGRSQS